MSTLRGLLSSLALAINTLFWCLLLYIPALLKLIPIPGWQRVCTVAIIRISEAWVTCNGLWMRAFLPTQWTFRGLEGLRHEGWYLVISNHQSWVDIFTLQKALTGKAPFLKFFIKQELIWVPVIGLAWWALDFPFMKRHSPEVLKKRPELRGQDLDTTRKACEKFRTTPVSVMNFVEGTRFTLAKHQRQNSPYQHLLLPRLGGTGFVLGVMGDYLPTLLDCTLHYPKGRPGLWEFMTGRVPEIYLEVTQIEIPASLRGKDPEDAQFRTEFKTWMDDLWRAKDARLEALNRQTTRH